jgi:hypothetical protein
MRTRTTRRGALWTLAGAVLLGPFINRGRFRLFAQSTAEYSERAIRLIREPLVIDMLNQFLYRTDREQERENSSQTGLQKQSVAAGRARRVDPAVGRAPLAWTN